MTGLAIIGKKPWPPLTRHKHHFVAAFIASLQKNSSMQLQPAFSIITRFMPSFRFPLAGARLAAAHRHA